MGCDFRTCAAAALIVATGLGAIACGYANVDGDELGVPLPERAPPRSADASSPPPDAPQPQPASDAGANAEGGTRPTLCTEPDLVLCFPFDGTVADNSPSALQPLVSGVTFVPGKSGQAASLTAASAIRFAASPVFEVKTATVEAWLKLAPNPSGDGVVFDADERFSLTVQQDGKVLCRSSNADVSSGTVAADQWTHVACVYDGAKLLLYVGGVELDTGAGSIGSSPAAGAAIGGNAPSGEPFVGAIDSFRVFKVARTPAQIAAAAK